MLRIFIFLLFVLLLGYGFSWFADRPGDVELLWQGQYYKTSLMVVLVAIVALIAAIMILWWLAKTILDSPKIMSKFFQNRKKDKGYQALSRGLIAANSGDAAGARRYTKESVKLLGSEPLVELLDAQSALLEGDREGARAKFETMLEDDETRLVALRGLYLEAERQGAGDAARHYAEEAHKSAPALGWAGNAKLKYASRDGDWEGALATLEANKSAGLLDKAAAKRQKAVLLTAQAMATEPGDPVKAAKYAREAHKLAPSLVPAAIIGAKALARNSDIGRASGILESVWKKEPHPEIANSYVYLRIGDSASDRLKRAKKLAAMKANHLEGNFAIAEAAIDAQDWKTAREIMLPVLNTNPTERACLIMADIEEGQYGDKGRMRDWLSRAVRAPKDAAWTADGYVSEKWLPFSPVTGKIDAFEWKLPGEQLGGPENAVLDAEGLADLIAEPAPAPEPVSDPVSGPNVAAAAAVATATILPSEIDEAEAAIVKEGSAKEDEPVETTQADSVGKTDESEKTIEAEGEEAATATVASDTEATVEEVASNAQSDADSGDDSEQDSVQKPEADKKSADENTDANEASSTVEEVKEGEEKPASIFALDRRPDDPGIREGQEAPKPKRFGIF